MNILAKNLMILASAGSGKTFQLGNRVIGRIALNDVDPERMVALTFTRKAAGEFADSVLTKLANGTLDPKVAQSIGKDLGQEVDVGAVLERVIQALPRLQFTTMDGFFSRIVRGFQNELGLSGGTFDLLEGERLATAEAEILEGVMRDGFEERQDFYHAFRKATLGRGQQGVQRSLEDFIGKWHRIWKEGVKLQTFGNPEVFQGLPEVKDWMARKDGLIAALRKDDAPKVWNALLDIFSDHSVGQSPNLNQLGKRLLAVFDEPGPVEVKEGRGTLRVEYDDWVKWKELYQLAIDCELRSAVDKTQAVGALMEEIDKEHVAQLRRRGLLSFDDVKILLGEWSQSEDARLRRELIDYRLDGRFDHWLLDEFQDTSPAEWNALEPLMDEAVSDPDGSLFIVGDRKQGIYAWRGGDVTLFDRLLTNYGNDESGFDGVRVESMDKSYRSCPAVLALVNAVCGNLPLIERLFGKSAAAQWQWHDHVSFDPSLSGEAKVVEVSKDDEGAALVAQLKALGIGEKKLSCGVLVRTGALVTKYAELLRAENFDVIEAGERTPGEDHAVGVALVNFMEWLADPANEFAREVVEMSPLVRALTEFGESWGERWDRILREIQRSGFARFVSRLIEKEWGDLGLYGRRRAEDLIAALVDFDGQGEACPRAACAWIRDLKVGQAPGAAAIQVMTIHKSKGLGFDVVMLPELPDRNRIPEAGKFKVARGRDWLLDLPGKWAYEKHPEISQALERWEQGQIYENLCLLYVALTRAKRGLYVFLPEEPKSRQGEKGIQHATPANLVRQSTGMGFPESDPDWTSDVPDLAKPDPAPLPSLAEPKPQRARTSPSAEKGGEFSGGGSGRRIGTEVHELFETIEWLEPGEVPSQPYSAAGKIVEDALKIPEIHRVFVNDGSTLYREQPIEVIVNGKWMSGIVDRMHVSEDGIEVYDFKTDAVSGVGELLSRYRGQMEAYQKALAKIFGKQESQIVCRMVSTHLSQVIGLEGEPEQGQLNL